MKILWFEVTPPARYTNTGLVIGGWQDALEVIVRTCPEIELHVAFATSDANAEDREVDGVTYHPMKLHFSIIEKIQKRFTWKPEAMRSVEAAKKVVDKVKPDLIHVFGCEWPYGLVAEYTDIPLVIHIQGAIVPYYNALYPPKYNDYTFAVAAGLNLKKQCNLVLSALKSKTRRDMELKIWKAVSHYMGRTAWDRSLTHTLHPGATYHFVNEALRPSFLSTQKRWRGIGTPCLKILSTGISTFWKGPDVLLKTAHVLKTMGVDFEWQVAGNIDPSLKKVIEKHENLTFAENNVTILGFISPDELVEKLCGCSLYVHTAYIENSPNSICEAQLLGVPIVSTQVGGIESLVRNGQDGVLVPANDPWRLAYEILQLWADKDRMMKYSENTHAIAKTRHNPNNILHDLLACYNRLITQDE